MNIFNKYDLATWAKKIIIGSSEDYVFNNTKLKFRTGTRPIRKKYIDAKNDVVRNDVLQNIYFEQNFKPDHVLWDIGSHHGHYGIFCASIVKGNNQIFSFEPDNTAMCIQKENIALNNFDRKITVFESAVSDKDGTVFFNSMDGNSNSHISKNGTGKGEKVITVKTKCLNTLLSELPKPNFVKIDTEGAEIDILTRADKLLADKEINFICELHPFAWDSFDVKYEIFTEILKKYNRSLKLLDEKKSIADLPFYGTVIF